MQTFDEAQAYLLQQAQPTQKTETLPVTKGLGRILAKGIISNINVPPHDNSMMDGYVLNAKDYDPERLYEISQRIPAGTVGTPLTPNTLARIFTGAPIPKNANMVIMQEETEQIEGKIKFTAKTPRPGQNIRRKGEDIAQGTEILKQGHQLKTQDLGLISSIGIAEIEVYQPLTLATFTTGDELLEPGETATPGKIYNANRFMLAGLIQECGFNLIDLGRVPDTLEATISALKEAAQSADLVITSGGVSVGEEDHIKPAIETLGSLDMWTVKMKPGKPLAYGQINQVPFIGLPGNPVSAFATFQLFARPYLMKMQGKEIVVPHPIWVEADFNWPKPGFRREFARARLLNKQTTNGNVTRAQLYANQGSGVLTSTVWADGFIVIPEDTQIKAGDKVAYYPFNAF